MKPPTEWSRSEHQAHTAKHLPPCFSVVRVDEGVALFACRGSQREFINIFPIYADLVTYLLEESDRARASARAESERQARLAAIRRDESLISDYDLSSLNMDIDL